MREDGGRTQRRMRNHASRNTVDALPIVWRPNFRAKKPEASLDQAVVQMRENDIVAILGRIGIKSDGALHVSVRMFETHAAFLPAWIDEMWHMIRARDAFQDRRYQLRLAREVESNVDDGFDVLRRKVKIAARFIKLVC